MNTQKANVILFKKNHYFEHKRDECEINYLKHRIIKLN